MVATLDAPSAPEPAPASPRDAPGQGPYRQPVGSIVLAATPIGDARDASARLVSALEGADIVAAEDTRRALALASRLGIRLGGRLIALHDHNEGAKAAGIVEAAGAGARVVFVSDAGMPTVSDPGFRLARAAFLRGGAPVRRPWPMSSSSWSCWSSYRCTSSTPMSLFSEMAPSLVS